MIISISSSSGGGHSIVGSTTLALRSNCSVERKSHVDGIAIANNTLGTIRVIIITAIPSNNVEQVESFSNTRTLSLVAGGSDEDTSSTSMVFSLSLDAVGDVLNCG